MNKWWLIGVIVVCTLLLMFNHDVGTTFGVSNSQFGGAAYYAIWGLAILPFLWWSHSSISEMAKHALIWLAIIMLLATGYVYRHDFQDTGHRITAGWIPASPTLRANSGEATQVTIYKGQDDHFEVKANINERQVLLLVDTGASYTVLTNEDARAVGIDVENMVYLAEVQTANGKTNAAFAKADTIKIGEIERYRQRIMVAQPGDLNISLLGMSFMNTLAGMNIRSDEMTFID